MFFIDRAESLEPSSLTKNKFPPIENVFVSGRIGPTILFKTRAIKNPINPVWAKKCKSLLCQESENITINIRNMINDLGGSSEVASIQFSCEDMVKGNKIDGWFTLRNNGRENGRIKMSLQFHSKLELEKLKHEQVIKEISLFKNLVSNVIVSQGK